jgi:hypothetical protein
MLPLMLPLMCGCEPCAHTHAHVRACVCVCGGGSHSRLFCIPGESPVLWKCICRYYLQLWECLGFPFGVDATQLTIASADNHSLAAPPRFMS